MDAAWGEAVSWTTGFGRRSIYKVGLHITVQRVHSKKQDQHLNTVKPTTGYDSFGRSSVAAKR